MAGEGAVQTRAAGLPRHRGVDWAPLLEGGQTAGQIAGCQALLRAIRAGERHSPHPSHLSIALRL